MRSSSLPIVPTSVSPMTSPIVPGAPLHPAASAGLGVAERPQPSYVQLPAGPASSLTAREEAALAALCRAVIPGGPTLPAAGPEIVRRLQGLLSELGSPFALGYRGLLHSLGALSRLRYRRGLADLAPDQLAALLDGLLEGGFARRLFLRAIAAPIKALYFDDPAIYARLGQRYRDGRPSEEAALARLTPDDQPAYVRARTRRACDIPNGETLEVDAVVIGSGAGGAVAAYELAAAGHAVLLLEEGALRTSDSFKDM
ncbi:MAG TPA: FAD-binding protein, partial [Pseudomonadota bacterium]|nr:FAD-binding protein [Pseudomonadota bacterium]